MEVIERGGEHCRVADPDWEDLLDGSYSMRFGGRWNAPGSFPVIYLNADLDTARANARHLLTERLRGQPFMAEDLDPAQLPVLVWAAAPARRYLDVVTRDGIVANGLPTTYPLDESGQVVPRTRCQPIGQGAWEGGLPGVAGRPAVESAPPTGEELAFFDRHEVELEVTLVQPFEQWYGPFDW
ncbi:MAG TPA: RES domain-containing protein [Acidimicrobiales bacterium]|nr:RES domain-containing protein [Acidimicrobiales bacterium]